MTHIIQSTHIDQGLQRRNRIKDGTSSCLTKDSDASSILQESTYRLKQAITDYVGCTLVFINYIAVRYNHEGHRSGSVLVVWPKGCERSPLLSGFGGGADLLSNICKGPAGGVGGGGLGSSESTWYSRRSRLQPTSLHDAGPGLPLQ